MSAASVYMRPCEAVALGSGMQDRLQEAEAPKAAVIQARGNEAVCHGGSSGVWEKSHRIRGPAKVK